MKQLAALFTAMVLLCMGLTGFPAMAESTAKDGIHLTVTTNRDQYAWWEPVQVQVQVQNTNAFVVRNAELSFSGSEGFQFADGSTLPLGDLQPGVQYQFDTRATNPHARSPVPLTGDGFPALPLAAGLLLSGLGILLLCRAGARRSAALLVCVLVLGSAAAQADIIRKSFRISSSFLVDDAPAHVTVTLRYDFYGEKRSHSTSSTPKPTPPPEPRNLSQYIQFPDLVDLNISEGVTITAEGLPALKRREAVYVYADCSFVLSTQDGEHVVPYTLRVGDEVVEPDAPAVIFTQDGTAVVAIELHPPKNAPEGTYNGSIEFRTETVTNHKAAAQ